MTLPEEEEQKRLFLADVQQEFVMLCCRTLTNLTVQTNDAFLSVARRGRTPPRSATKSKSKNAQMNDDESEAPLNPRRDVFTVHEETYRSVRSAVAASGALGHRSCHVLWGPRGCGKHRILRLLAKDSRQRKGSLALYLDGDALTSDEDALRDIAQQMLDFLQSPNSEELRAADWSIRTGTFEFGKLFNFDKYIVEHKSDTDNNGESDSEDEVEAESAVANISGNLGGRKKGFKKESGNVVSHRTAARRAARRKSKAPARKRPTKGRRLPSSSSSSSSNSCGDQSKESDADASSEGDDPLLQVTTTTAWGGGGAASALPALQRALLLIKSYSINLVICIRRVERFGVWCDQLLYVLSGLMHESDGRGGGMSLVMTSSTPDIRHLEKRLSSRLTCETRYVPLLPWTATRVVRATLTDAREQLERFLSASARTAADTGAVKRSRSGAAADGAQRPALHRRPQLRAAAARALADAALADLSAAADPPAADGLAARCAALAKRQRGAGATAGRVVAGAAGLFADAAGGRAPLVGPRGRAAVLAWLTRRLRREAEGEETEVTEVTGGAERAPATAPGVVRAFWLSARPAGSPAARRAPLADAEDGMWDCRILENGYASREAMLVLIYAYLRHEQGVSRTVTDLLEDIASSLGTRAAAALDGAAFRAAIAALHRWRILSVSGNDGASGVVALRGSATRVREFLQEALRNVEWCESVVGFDAKELMRLRNLV